MCRSVARSAYHRPLPSLNARPRSQQPTPSQPLAASARRQLNLGKGDAVASHLGQRQRRCSAWRKRYMQPRSLADDAAAIADRGLARGRAQAAPVAPVAVPARGPAAAAGFCRMLRRHHPFQREIVDRAVLSPKDAGVPFRNLTLSQCTDFLVAAKYYHCRSRLHLDLMAFRRKRHDDFSGMARLRPWQDFGLSHSECSARTFGVFHCDLPRGMAGGKPATVVVHSN
jgi:hypothetical protein